MAIYLYNTLSRKKELFKPIEDQKVSLYCCGPTVYNYAHIGNLRTFLFEDFLRRMFEYNSYSVTHVTNITDVGHLTDDGDDGEDKMQKGAQREGKSVHEIAKHYTDAFLSDIASLNILTPTILPKATDHISDMIKMIKTLQDKGFTYTVNGNVYFDTSKFPYYPDLGKMNLSFLKETARVSSSSHEKKHPSDFVLWFTNSKFENHAMVWESPFGKGYPGWHIECSAMSTKYLGLKLDIHCGGVDHIQVHHTNEIAQTECCYGNHSWVNFWLHGEFLVFNKGKMSKSDGTFITLSTLQEKGYDPVVFRFFCLTTHYRQKLQFSYETLSNAKHSFLQFKRKVVALQKEDSTPSSKYELKDIDFSDIMLNYKKQFLEAINDDLNIPKAFSLCFDILKSDLSDKEKLVLLLDFDSVFGLNMESFEDEKVTEIPSDIQELLNKRDIAREKKDWDESDKLRDLLLEKGFLVKDSKEGQVLEKV